MINSWYILLTPGQAWASPTLVGRRTYIHIPYITAFNFNVLWQICVFNNYLPHGFCIAQDWPCWIIVQREGERENCLLIRILCNKQLQIYPINLWKEKSMTMRERAHCATERRMSARQSERLAAEMEKYREIRLTRMSTRQNEWLAAEMEKHRGQTNKSEC